MSETRYKILLIEDNKLDQMAFQRFIEAEQYPYDCVVASSVAEAQIILKNERFDVVIADYNLGDGTALEILKLAKDTPVILVTGQGDEEVAVKTWRAGAYDYLTKDLERNYLKALPITVENAIRHRRTEQQLQLLSGAIMCTDESVYITDLEDKILFVNKAFCKTYGYREEEIVGQNSSILWIGPSQNLNSRSVFQTRMAGTSWEVGFYHRRKDSTIFPVSLSRSLIKDAKGNEIGIVGVARDISERIFMEDQLRSANLALQRHGEAQMRLAVAATNSLLAALERHQIDKAKRLAQDLLNLMDAERANRGTECAALSLARLVEQAADELRPIALQRNIRLELCSCGPQLTIQGSPNRLRLGIRRLIEIAMDQQGKDGQICITATETENRTILRIATASSAGCRKQSSDQSSIQEQIIKPDTEETKQQLALVEAIVEPYAGQLWLESDNDNHTEICLALPKSNVQPASVVVAHTCDSKS